MSRISLLTLVGTLLLTPAVAQAEAIPLFKNLTTPAVVFHDDFEGGTVGEYPVATTGTWTVDQKHASAVVAVTDFATSDILPYEGSQFLKTAGADGVSFVLRGTGTAATGASDVIEMQIAFHQTEGGMTGLYQRNGITSTQSFLLPVGLAGSYTVGDTTWTTEVIYYNYNGAAWVGSGLQYDPGVWNTLKVTHANLTNAWAISLNGGAPVTVAGNSLSLTNTWDAFDIRECGGTTTTYFDAVPEPGTLALLATGLIGLLCYAWRKRKCAPR